MLLFVGVLIQYMVYYHPFKEGYHYYLLQYYDNNNNK